MSGSAVTVPLADTLTVRSDLSPSAAMADPRLDKSCGGKHGRAQPPVSSERS